MAKGMFSEPLKAVGREMIAGVASIFLNRLNYPNGSFQGASSSRQAMKAWTTTNASPDVDAISNLEILRSRSRDLVRNVPSAKAALKKKSIHVVNTGIRFRSRLDYEALGLTRQQARQYERKITKVFHRWAKSKNSDATRVNNFYQNTLLIYHSMLESGDSFILLPFINRPNAFLDLAIKVIESDLCAAPSTTGPEVNNAGGIELDEWGAAVQYWFKRHYDVDVEHGDSNEPFPVPAYGETTGRPLVLHVFTPDRPGQRRGIPLLAPVIEPLKQLGRYKDAELMAAVVAGMFTVFIKTITGTSMPGSIAASQRVGSGPNADDQDGGDYEMSYGGVVNLRPDEAVDIADPTRPNPNFDAFTNSILKEIGGALGIGYEMIQGYYSSSYTAARAAFLDAFAGFRVELANIISDFCEPTKDTVILNAVLRGKLDLPGYLDDPDVRELWQEGTWVAPAFGQLDPYKETMARKVAVESRLKSRTKAVLESDGEDNDVMMEEIAEEQRRERELGIVPEVVNQNISQQNSSASDSGDASGDDTDESEKQND